MSLIISGATIIDGVASNPVEGHSIWIEGTRVKAIGKRDEIGIPPGAAVIDARGKYVIPGLMNANAQTFSAIYLEGLARYSGRYEELIAEAAQVALKNGLTTVFNTWGPRRYLMKVRDRINAGEVVGSRIFCAGNIIGFDGPLSEDFDFIGKGVGATSPALANRINSIWVENVGRHLMWRTPERVAEEVRAYIAKGIDFIKYAANEHVPGAFIAFSERTQAAIVEEAHRAGITAQAHTMTVEGVRIAIEAGCDLIQHINLTGPEPIPEDTLELCARRKTGAVVYPYTKRAWDWIMQAENETDKHRLNFRQASDVNARNLIRSGAPLLLGNDGVIIPPEILAMVAKSWEGVPEEERSYPLATGHFAWFKAMEEKECPPMEILRGATRNIAEAYGKGKDLGTVEPGKIADMLILDKNPLQAAENYRSIHSVIKDGAVVDREALPLNPILTKPVDPPAEEEASYIPFLSGDGAFPGCPLCMLGDE